MMKKSSDLLTALGEIEEGYKQIKEEKIWQKLSTDERIKTLGNLRTYLEECRECAEKGDTTTIVGYKFYQDFITECAKLFNNRMSESRATTVKPLPEFRLERTLADETEAARVLQTITAGRATWNIAHNSNLGFKATLTGKAISIMGDLKSADTVLKQIGCGGFTEVSYHMTPAATPPSAAAAPSPTAIGAKN